jgi:hypothetical protein
MVKILELAISKAATLSEAAQEEIGRELIRQIDALAALRAEIDVGLAELDAGLGKEIDFDALLKELNEDHAKQS